MNSADTQQSEARSSGSVRSAGWSLPALAGAAAFWSANFAISLTPVAADFRSARSITYGPMLVEAAVAGLAVAGAVAFLLSRFADRLPGHSPLGKALMLAAGALLLLTVLVAVPSTLTSDVTDPGHWLLVETVINAIRILALGVAVGLVARARTHRRERQGPVAGRARP